MIDRRQMLALTASAGALPFAGPTAWAADDPASRVDPFIGTDGTGHTFPGPSRPFGMVQPGPDNAASGWEYTSGYQYRAPRIMGFSQNRASGTGIPELGDVLLQPSADRREDLASTYAKPTEVARPGYYAVTLAENGVRVELTSTLRSAYHRYRFARGGRVWVLVDLQHGLTFRSDRQPVQSVSNTINDTGFEGEAVRQNWTTRHVAWSAQFNRPIAAVETLSPRAGDVLALDVLGQGEEGPRGGQGPVDPGQVQVVMGDHAEPVADEAVAQATGQAHEVGGPVVEVHGWQAGRGVSLAHVRLLPPARPRDNPEVQQGARDVFKCCNAA